MDLLEYQGKQLFRKRGVPTPGRRHAASAGRNPTQVAEIAVEILGARV
jgi:succinyl-CoA synthetase beta subunit